MEKIPLTQVPSILKTMNEGSSSRLIHPYVLKDYTLTYYYLIEITDNPRSTVTTDEFFNILEKSLDDASESAIKEEFKVNVTKDLDMESRRALLSHHIRSLDFPIVTEKGKYAGMPLSTTYIFNTAGGRMHPGNHHKETVRMAEGKEGLLELEWYAAYHREGMLRMVAGKIYSDLVPLTRDEADVIKNAGVKEFGLYASIQADIAEEERAKKKQKRLPILGWFNKDG